MNHKLLLQSLGFNAKSEKVYRALLTLADAPVSAIATKSGQKRTSTYHVLADLESKGLVGSYKNRGRKRYFAENPDKLISFFHHQSIIASRLMPILQADIRENNSKVKLRALSGQRAIIGMNEDALNCKQKEILTIGSSRKLLEYLGGKIAFGERRRKLGIQLRSLRFSADHAFSSIEKMQKTRVLSDQINLPGYIMIYDNVVNIILYEEDGIGVVIESASFAGMMRSFFEAMWMLGNEAKRIS